MDILFELHDLVLHRIDDNKIPTFNRNHIYAIFYFDEEWMDLCKYALFVTPNEEKYVIYLGYGKEKRCIIPNEVLTNTFFGVSVFADDLLVSTQENILLSPSGYSFDIDELDLEETTNAVITTIDDYTDLHKYDEEPPYIRPGKEFEKEEHIHR